MSTRVYESALIAAPIDKVWERVRPVDFKFLDTVKSTVMEGKADAAEVGGIRTITYQEGTVQKIKLTELSDARHMISYELVESTPAVSVLSAVHTIQLRRVTTHNQTMIEYVSDFSKDATSFVLQDSKFKKIDFFKALSKACVKRRKNWIPLESNPKLMNKYCKMLGVNMTGLVEFQDVISLESDALSWVQSPQLAILLTFPINKAIEDHRKDEEKRLEAKAQTISPNVYHCKQTVGNACGTVALLHAVANNTKTLPLEKGKFFDRFLSSTSKMDANARAQALEDAPEIEVTHQATANDPDAKSNAASSFNDALHFNAFVAVDGHLYELDGRKKFPINHGPTTPNTLLKDAVKVIKEFMGRVKGDGRFAIIALAPPSPFSD